MAGLLASCSAGLLYILLGEGMTPMQTRKVAEHLFPTAVKVLKADIEACHRTLTMAACMSLCCLALHTSGA